MNWQASPRCGDVEAIGARGIYTISPAPAWKYALRGVGHCGLNMLALPTSGRLFDSPGAARGYADRLDKVAWVEPLASGT